jgi:two-component system, cell cycle sensor histidine kinase and response regulator CckA
MAKGLHSSRWRLLNVSESLWNTTVLVVEDTVPLCKMISSMLRDSGFRVLEAADGAEALSVLSSEGDRIRLVLTDLIMPHMSGKELARRVAELHPKLPVLFMSGYTEDPIFDEVSGALFLRKPFTAPVLIETVRRVLAGAMTQPHNGFGGSEHC